jgi:5,10-methylenetetrahydromethanopterin reductase
VEISCGLAPSLDVVQHAQLAEQLGYERVWLYDSPAIYLDVWACLAAVAQQTSRVGLGTAVAVPHLRSDIATAAAIATIEGMAPGRLVCAWGTGATARWTLGQRALSMAALEQHLRRIRGLLRGEVVEEDGRALQMMHLPGYAPPRPIEVPFLLSALGPKGQALAKDVADGIMTVGFPAAGWEWSSQLVVGTVLDDGESVTDRRVQEAAGPWYAIMIHGAWESDPAAAEMFPGGADWRSTIESLRPEGQRHLVVHEGHATLLTDRDRGLVEEAGDGIAGLPWVADRAGTKAKLEETAAGGATEVVFAPSGPDIDRELRAFAEAAGIG